MASHEIDKPDVHEHGGRSQKADRRLFMQLLAFGECVDTQTLASELSDAGIRGVVYENLLDPRGVAILAMHENADWFVADYRDFLNRSAVAGLRPQPRFTMFGRTYALGYEPDLDDTLIDRPMRTVLDPKARWAVWYPLRRCGSFANLPPDEQRAILMEHGAIGRAWGEAGHAHDIRLKCHGLDTEDNDFVIGLIGPQLHPLSRIVEQMRQTQQTSKYLERLGPFWIGRAAWQSGAPAETASET